MTQHAVSWLLLNLIEIQAELGSIRGFIFMCNDLFFFLPSAFMFFSVSVITVHMLSCKNQMRKKRVMYIVDNQGIPQCET